MNPNLSEGERLFQEGKIEDAKVIFHNLLQITPDDPEILSNLGVIAFSEKNVQEAEKYFLRALEFEKAGTLNPIDSSIFHNLGIIYYINNDFDKSEQNFGRAIEIEPDNIDVIYGLGKLYRKLADNGSAQKIREYRSKLLAIIESLYKENKMEKAHKLAEKGLNLFPQDAEFINDYAVICSKLDRPDEAQEKIAQANKLSSKNTDINDNYHIIFNDEILRNTKQLTEIESKRKKIALFCGPDDKFIRHIIERQASKHEIKTFSNGSIQEMHNLMKWSDISWFEWCDGLILHATKLPKECRIICRLHSYEAFGDIMKQVNWQVVDDLIFVAPHIRDIAINQMPSIKNNTHLHVIPNGVNLQKYEFKDRKKGLNIAYVGYINHKKNPSLLLQCMKHLIDIDNRFVLHIAGQHQELRFKLYFDHMIKEMDLSKNIISHGWINDVNTWLEDKHFTISTSVLESFCHGIADAMACGLKPLIHNFVGAKELYPEKYIFNTIKEFGDMVLSDEYKPIEYREYIENNYSQDNQLNEIDKLLNSTLYKETLVA